MFQAIQNFLSTNDFGKSYSEIDKDEQAELQLQAQASTAVTNQDKLLGNKDSNNKQSISDATYEDESPNCRPKMKDVQDDILLNSLVKSKEAEPQIQFPHTARDIISDQSSVRYAADSKSGKTLMRQSQKNQIRVPQEAGCLISENDVNESNEIVQERSKATTRSKRRQRSR